MDTFALGGYSHDLIWRDENTPLVVKRYDDNQTATGDSLLSLAKDEYFVKLVMFRIPNTITMTTLTTNKRRSVAVGTRDGGATETHVINAPEGYKIVGFHGKAYTGCAPTWFYTLGALFAPI